MTSGSTVHFEAFSLVLWAALFFPASVFLCTDQTNLAWDPTPSVTEVRSDL